MVEDELFVAGAPDGRVGGVWARTRNPFIHKTRCWTHHCVDPVLTQGENQTDPAQHTLCQLVRCLEIFPSGLSISQDKFQS